MDDKDWDVPSWPPLGRQDLIRVLTNRLYMGRVHCPGQSYPGEHRAIVEERVWQRVQSQLEKTDGLLATDLRGQRHNRVRLVARNLLSTS